MNKATSLPIIFENDKESEPLFPKEVDFLRFRNMVD